MEGFFHNTMYAARWILAPRLFWALICTAAFGD